MFCESLTIAATGVGAGFLKRVRKWIFWALWAMQFLFQLFSLTFGPQKQPKTTFKWMGMTLSHKILFMNTEIWISYNFHVLYNSIILLICFPPKPFTDLQTILSRVGHTKAGSRLCLTISPYFTEPWASNWEKDLRREVVTYWELQFIHIFRVAFVTITNKCINIVEDINDVIFNGKFKVGSSHIED